MLQSMSQGLQRQVETVHGEKMKTLKAIASVTCGVMLGGVTVGLYYRQLLYHEMSQSIIEASQSKVLYAVDWLTMLREERTLEFFENKEEEISAEIYALSQVLSPSSVTEEQRRLFSMVARYREKFPYRTGDRTVDDQVFSFLDHFGKREFDKPVKKTDAPEEKKN